MKGRSGPGIVIGGWLLFALALTGSAAPPGITHQPQDQTVILYQSVTFTVQVTSDAPGLYYQWLKNSAAIPEATNAQILISHAQFSDEGSYSVTVSNADGKVTSASAELKVNLPKAGDVDYSFFCSGPIGSVQTVALQPDGKVLIAGSLTLDGSHSATPGVARLNADGTIDHSFANVQADDNIRSLVVQSDGRIVMAGAFNSIAGAPFGKVARLNPDGSLDPTFHTSIDGSVISLALQTDGKLIINGYFNSIDGMERHYLARMNTNGSLDLAFSEPALSPQTYQTAGGTNTVPPYIGSILLQTDGKLCIGGSFAAINGVAQNDFARLNPDGSLDDATWSVGTLCGTKGGIGTMISESDGNILVGGFYSGYNQSSTGFVARVYSTGGYQHFRSPLTPGIAPFCIAEQTNGTILVGGFGVPLMRFGKSGTSYNDLGGAILGLSGNVYSIAVQSDGKAVVAGDLSGTRTAIFRLNGDQSIDASFQGGIAPANNVFYCAVQQPDHKLIVGGRFTSIQNAKRNYIARLNSDGTLDQAFQNGLSGTDYDVERLFLQNDGKILLAGSFSYCNGMIRRGIARLNSDGTLDENFQDAAVLWEHSIGQIRSIVVQPDGKVLIGGNFISAGGAGHTNIARLNSDGTVDQSFQAVAWDGNINAGVEQVALQSDGKLLVAGTYSYINDEPCGHLARLNADGTRDDTFIGGITLWGGGAGAIDCLAIQSDAKILIGGFFTEVNGESRHGLARLNTDGTLDQSFQSPNMTNSYDSIDSVFIQCDGRIIVGGRFASINGAARTNFARLNSDGSLDAAFENNNALPEVLSFMQDDQKLFIGYERLWGTDFPPVLKNLTPAGSDMNLTWRAISNRTYRVQYTEAFSASDWMDLPGDVYATNGIAGKTDTTCSEAPRRFYRAVELP